MPDIRPTPYEQASQFAQEIRFVARIHEEMERKRAAARTSKRSKVKKPGPARSLPSKSR